MPSPSQKQVSDSAHLFEDAVRIENQVLLREVAATTRAHNRVTWKLLAIFALALVALSGVVAHNYTRIEDHFDLDLAKQERYSGTTSAEVGVIPAPTDTELSMYDKRFSFPWYIKAALKTTNQGFALFGLATACQGATESVSSALLCAYGAITTATGLFGAGQAVVTAAGEWFRPLEDNSGWTLEQLSRRTFKRGDDSVKQLERNMSAALGLEVTLDGFLKHNHSRIQHLNLPEGYQWPVLHFYNHRNQSFHYTITHKDGNSLRHTLAFGPKSSKSHLSTRDESENDYFTSGGIDMAGCYPDQNSAPSFDTEQFSGLEEDLQCLIPSDTAADSMEIEMDEDGGVLAAGSISAYQGDGQSGILSMPTCPQGLPAQDSCQS